MHFPGHWESREGSLDLIPTADSAATGPQQISSQAQNAYYSHDDEHARPSTDRKWFVFQENDGLPSGIARTTSTILAGIQRYCNIAPQFPYSGSAEPCRNIAIDSGNNIIPDNAFSPYQFEKSLSIDGYALSLAAGDEAPLDSDEGSQIIQSVSHPQIQSPPFQPFSFVSLQTDANQVDSLSPMIASHETPDRLQLDDGDLPHAFKFSPATFPHSVSSLLEPMSFTPAKFNAAPDSGIASAAESPALKGKAAYSLDPDGFRPCSPTLIQIPATTMQSEGRMHLDTDAALDYTSFEPYQFGFTAVIESASPGYTKTTDRQRNRANFRSREEQVGVGDIVNENQSGISRPDYRSGVDVVYHSALLDPEVLSFRPHNFRKARNRKASGRKRRKVGPANGREPQAATGKADTPVLDSESSGHRTQLDLIMRMYEKEDTSAPATKGDIRNVVGLHAAGWYAGESATRGSHCCGAAMAGAPKRAPVLGSNGPGIRVGEQPRPLSVTAAQKSIRTAFYNLMNRRTGKDPVLSQHIATPEEIRLFENGKHQGPTPTLDGFKVQIGKELATPWNDKVIDHIVVLVQDRCGIEDLRELRKKIKTCIEGIADKYRSQFKRVADPVASRDARKEYNRDQRRRNLHKRRAEVIHADTEVPLHRFAPVWDDTVYTMGSGDESETYDGQEVHVINKLPWKSLEFEEHCQLVDNFYHYYRLQKNGMQNTGRGRYPVHRVRGGNRRQRLYADAPVGLPSNFYSQEFIDTLSEKALKDLNRQPRFNLAPTAEEARISQEYSTIRTREDAEKKAKELN